MALKLTFVADAYPAGMRHPRHEHDSLHMSLVLSGRVSEKVGNSLEYAGALSVVAKDPGVVHANEFGDGGARLARLGLESGFVGDLIDDPSRSTSWRWTHDARVAKPFLRLVDRATHGATEFESIDPDVLDLLAAFTARSAREAKGTPPGWLQQTMDEMRETWHSGMTVAGVATRAGVHPVYLARVVKKWFGLGVGDELRRLRMQSAAAAIASGKTTISNVAHSSGYADEPHLCREFRSVLGVTPGRYRTLLRTLS